MARPANPAPRSTSTRRSPPSRAKRKAAVEVSVATFGPQSGPQELFFQSPADIAIYGGAAGGGKTWGLLIEAARWLREVSGYGAVIFRRTHPEIRNQGGMWDESFNLYQAAPLSGIPNETRLEWTFPPYGNTVTFAHMQHEHDRFKWQGAQIPLIGFDELTTFTRAQFFFMLSRNRSACGIRPYIRATTNPDADSWVAEFIAWWIDQTTGLPIPARAGALRWFKQDPSSDKVIWADTEAELLDPDDPDNRPLSVTFIPANVYDNTVLLERDPEYLRKLMQLPYVERQRLLGGNWKIRPSAGLIFNRGWFDIVDEVPHNVLARVRYWDKAATPPAPPQPGKPAKRPSSSWAVGARLAVTTDGRFFVEDIVRGQWLAPERNRVMLQTAERDGHMVFVWIEQEPGSGGKESAEISQDQFRKAGILAEIERVTGEKVVRAQPMSWQAEQRNVKLVRADWNEAYLAELDRFPDGLADDQVDASSGAFNKLARLYEEVVQYGFQPDDVGTEMHEAPPVVEVGDPIIESEIFQS